MTRGRTALLCAALVAASVLATLLGPEREVNDPHDLAVYAERGSWVLEGSQPYRDVFSEYPQVATWGFALPHLAAGLWTRLGAPAPAAADGQRLYRLFFSAAMAAALGLLVALAYRLRRGEGAPGGPAFLLLLPACLYFSHNRFDVVPALLVLAALATLRAGRPRAAFAVLAVATATKWYPLVLVPVLAVHLLQTDRRALPGAALVWAGTLALVALPTLVAIGPEGFAVPYRFHLARGPNQESLYFLLVRGLGLGEGATAVLGPAFLALQVGLAGLAATARVVRFEDVVRWSALAILGFMLFARFHSPQWILWVAPLLVVLARTRGEIAAIAAFDLLTYAFFPYVYAKDTRIPLLFVALVAARNLMIGGWILHLLRGASFRPARRWLAPGVAALALACSEAPEPAGGPPAAPDPGPAAASDEVADHLRALGYVTWDEDADRSTSGVIPHAPERVAPGLNLFTDNVDRVRLMDAEGRVLRTWSVPGGTHCEHVEVLSGPRLGVVCEGQALVLLDPADGRVLRRIEGDVHHDLAERPDGTLLVPVREEPVRYRGRSVRFDALLAVPPAGAPRMAWSSREAVDALRALHGPRALDRGANPALQLAKELYHRFWRGKEARIYEYYHLNTVEVLGPSALAEDPRFRPGNWLLGLRNADSVAVLDGRTREPLWHWGRDALELPHMPTLLPSGRLLVFDNGTHRGWTRVIEVDPPSGEIVWQHPAEPDPDFFSAYQGSSQRLANGNTLICLSDEGRVVEVTRDGALVWEYWNPDFGEKGRKRIYRFMRLAPGQGRALLEEGDARS